MARVTRFTGGKTKVSVHDNRVNRQVHAHGIRNLEAVLEEYRSDLVRTLNRTGTGRTYTTEGPFGHMVKDAGKSQHTASAPGESPVTLSGNLADSIETQIIDRGYGSEQAFGMVFTNVHYAPILEQGRGGQFPMAPRPMWQRVFMENMTKYERIVTSGGG